MKKGELKELLKPLIKQCIKEVLFEEGVLSNIVSEVVVGLKPAPILENKIQNPQTESVKQHEKENLQRQKIEETRKKMGEAMGQSAYNGINLFEGTEPLAKGGDPDAGESSMGALSGVDPSDPGIDISRLMEKAGVWRSMVGDKK